MAQQSKFGGIPVDERQVSRFGGVPVVEEEEMGAARGFLEGSNVMFANILAAPANLSNFAIDVSREALGLEPLEEPVFPSGAIEEGFQEAGFTTGIPFEELPENAQLGFRAGEVAAGAVPFVAAPLAAAQRITTALGAIGRGAPPSIVQTVVQTAARQPKTFAAVEAGGVAGAAQGAAIAEALAPDSPTARLAGEVIGGFLNPAGLLARSAGATFVSGKEFFRGFTRAGREQQASVVIRNALIDAGEDPAAIERALAIPSDVPLTAGLKTGSPALLAMERQLAVKNSDFSNLSTEMVDGAFKSFRGQIDNMVASGDPDAFRMAILARDEFFKDLIQQRISGAQREAAETLSAIPAGGSLGEASVQAQQALRAALKETRAVESSLWNKIPRNIPVSNLDGTRAAFTRMRSEILPEEALPFERSFSRILQKVDTAVPAILGQRAPSGTNTGELLRLRSRLLAKSRDLRANQKFDDARIHDILADGVLDDLRALDIPVSAEARQFSRLLNETFTQTFAGNVARTTAQGGLRVPPELLLERAFGGGGTKARLQFDQLQEAANLGDKAAAFRIASEGGTPPIGQMFGADVSNAQERVLALMSQRAVKDGVVNPQQLSKFLDDNAELLSRFPELRDSLSTAEGAQRVLVEAQNLGRQATQAVARRSAFARAAGIENPSKAIGSVIRGPEPIKRFEQLARLSKSSGAGAVDGMRSSVLDWAMQQSRSANGLDFNRFSRVLTDPLAQGKPSILRLMQNNKIISNAGVRDIEKVLGRASSIQEALLTGRKLDDVISEPDAIFDLVTRIVGARVGAQGGGAAAGAPLVAAGAGSRFARNLFQKVPASKLSEVLIEASSNPAFAAMLLRKAPSIKQRPQFQRQINAFLLQAGLITEED